MAKGASKLSGGSSAFSDLPVKGLVDTPDFDDFIRANLKNPEFVQYGRSHSMEDIEQLWRMVRTQEEQKDLHEMPIEDAISLVRDNVRNSTLDGWFRNADSSYKPSLMDQVLSSPGVLNAGMNIAFYNYQFAERDAGRTPLSFDAWLKTPQTVYRGSTGKQPVASDVFMSWSPDRKIAEGFAGKNGTVSTVTIRPIDTWGSFQTTSEQEFLVPVKSSK